ncbi:MAG: DNA cytosine methyltransferase [Caldilineaceae bacterium]|nr:DNA cytosine methyltransferase [Caldilineaceae bacterium]MBP8106164.1 DNA cytosine methyltransferase [Caldilineaceae bacterium]MBP8122258.1 DNA cytosine methyltransferase [Caldilineaceae bacterium]
MNEVIQTSLFTDWEDHHEKGWFDDALDTLEVNEHNGWPDRFGDALHSWTSKNQKSTITAISLFSGGGGLDIGFHDAGFQIVECNELEPAFAATLQKNTAKGLRLEGTKIVCQDIGHYTPSVNHVDFIIGGPPCQTFSAAGARAAGVNGTDDERGNLFLQYARILEALQPKGFLFENVYRIVGAQDGKPWAQIQETFLNLGYKIYWRILDAADYGVPQFRERLIIVGLKEGTFKFPFPSHGPDSPDNREYFSSGQAVKGIDASGYKIGINGRHGYLLNDIPPGLNYSFYTERMGHPRPLFAWRSKFSDYLYKADPNWPVRTVKAQGGQYTGPFSWENRPFTVEELKRLQTFPDNYSIEGGRQNVIRQIGNSVPPQMARILALSILDQVFGVSIPFEISLMPDDYQLGFRKRKSELTSIYAEKARIALEGNESQAHVPLVNRNGIEFFSLTSDLQIKEKSSEEKADFRVEISLTDQTWSVELHDSNTEETPAQYEIQITPPPTGGAENGKPITARLVSHSSRHESMLGLWKIYEYYVKKYLVKDDLVQLFGYYQYKKVFSFTMKLLDESLMTDAFWDTVKRVTMGVGVGEIVSAPELTFSLGLSSDDELFSCLRMMKKIGYEIRNHKTNQQIRKGMVLIPYPFPTLNERSLQRLTRL